MDDGTDGVRRTTEAEADDGELERAAEKEGGRGLPCAMPDLPPVKTRSLEQGTLEVLNAFYQVQLSGEVAHLKIR